MTPVLGLDFGTSNTTAGCMTAAGPQLLPLEEGQVTIPSAIFFNLDEECVQFGREAIAAYTGHYEGRLLRALKSVLGSALMNEATQVGHEQLTFKDILGRFLGHVRSTAQAQLTEEIDSVVLGRPVWFVDDDSEKDRLAQDQLEAIARTCGFKHVAFQYEPIAAALEYESRVGREELALIADIGGGTSDFSIVRVSAENHSKLDRKGDVLANTGVHVGGTDFDKRLSLAEVMPHLGYKSRQRLRPELEMPSVLYFDLATWHRIPLLYSKVTVSFLQEMHYIAGRPELVHRLEKVAREQSGHRLAGDVEAAKIVLTESESVRSALPYVEEELVVEFSRVALEAATADEVTKITRSISECLRQAGVTAADIDTLFTTGGTSAIPAVRDACQKAVPQAKFVEGDKFGSVGRGLVIDAGLRVGVRP